MAARTVAIGDRHYKTMTAAKKAVQEVLNRYKAGQRLSSDDKSFVTDVLLLHPRSAEKIGCGVAEITVEDNRKLGFPSRGFYVTRTDGSKTDFSYLDCLAPRSHRDEVLRAFRTVVTEQVLEFRLREFSRGNVSCAISGVALKDDDSTHVDHETPFASLVESFLALQSLSVDAIEVLPSSDMNAKVRLRDPKIALAFSGFHESMATLRMVSKSANLARKRKP